MTTTYELYTNENGTPKAVEGKAPAIIERVETLETSVETLETSVETLEETLDNDVVTSVNGNTGDVTPEQTGCLPLSGGDVTGRITTSNGVYYKDANGYYTTFQKIVNNGFFIENRTPDATLRSRIAFRDDTNENAGRVEIDATNATQKATLYLQPDGGIAFGGKHLVKSVNGTTADASGNVAITVPSNTVSEKYNGTASVTNKDTITITGLTPYKPLYVECKNVTSKSGGTLYADLNSGIALVSPTKTTILNKNETIYWVVIPIQTSVSLALGQKLADTIPTAHVVAYQ